MFQLHPQLQADTVLISELPLCSLLLCKDANYPWCILVPRRENIGEIHQLKKEERLQLLEESCSLSQVMEEAFQADKMNVAALGNVVPQLHIHHIARYTNDSAWPKPIWGVNPTSEYSEEEMVKRIEIIREGMQGLTD